MKIYNTKRAGISLVALVVTIIVLIILTAAVIVTFMEGGIVDRAKEAVFKNDIKTYQEILTVKRAEEQIEIATGNGEGTISLNGTTAAEIQAFIPEFKEEYEGIIKVVNGEIVLVEGYEEIATDLQEKWLSDLGLSVANSDDTDDESGWDNSLLDANVLALSNNNTYLSGFADGVDKTQYTSISIPDTVTTIGVSAFSGCSNLTSIAIPNSVTMVDEFVF